MQISINYTVFWSVGWKIFISFLIPNYLEFWCTEGYQYMSVLLVFLYAASVVVYYVGEVHLGWMLKMHKAAKVSAMGS